ncbi:hypothetical protein [Arthrobacter rhombi]|uniref:hypothetical protein n=1 Tax=Arthrobacter rhombi TaxID=71253 RepID=UPI003FD2113C
MTNIQRTLIAAGAVAMLVGSVGMGAFAANSATAPEPQQQGPPPLAAEPDTGAVVETDTHDNVVKDTGDAAVLIDDSGKRQFTLEVTRSKVVTDCPARVGGFRLQPENRRFLVLDVKATLANSVTAEVPGSTEDIFMPLVAQAFSVVGNNGVIDREVATESAWGCYPDVKLAPALVDPGQSVQGKVVLDVPYGSGTVVYDPDNNGGWSWPY